MTEKYDVAVIGGGSGGYVAAIRAAQLGLSVVVIEEDKVGGTCLHRGCIPTKALLQSAALLDQLRQGAAFGVTAGEVKFDYEVAGKRRDDVVEQLHRGVQFLLKKNRVRTLQGRGQMTGTGSVFVEGPDASMTELDATHIIVATGSRPRQLPGVPTDGTSVLTSDDALLLATIPKSAIIVGAGAVGVEFASLWRSCGAEVTLVEMAERLVPLEDDAVGEELRKQFEARGIRCLVSAKLDLDSVERSFVGPSITAIHDDKEERLSAEVLLIATGRTANTENIGLETVGVTVENGTIKVDGQMATTAANIYAVGDVVGGFWLAHKAMHEGVIAAEAIANRNPHPLDPKQITRTTYCSPQIASMGLSEREAKEAGYEVRVGVMPLSGNPRAVIWGQPGGFCKVVADGEGNMLGVHIIGHEVTELIYSAGLGALVEATPFEFGRAVAPHPTLSEVLMEAALATSGEAIHI